MKIISQVGYKWSSDLNVENIHVYSYFDWLSLATNV
jgi:hypothetical protein